MSLLSICVNAANAAGVIPPATVIGSTDPAAIRLLQLTRRECRSLSSRVNWTALTTEHVFIAQGSSTFTLPPDFRSLVSDTLWDRTRFWKMRGAMSPQQWQRFKSSPIGRATLERRWRIRMTSGDAAGAGSVFEIDPPIGATDFTSTFVFEYVSNNWCRSATKFSLEEAVIDTAGTNYVINDLLTLAGGTSTTTATLRVTGIGAGGVITAAQVETPGVYTILPVSPASVTGGAGAGAKFTINAATFPGDTNSDWTADTDVALLDEDLIEVGVIWRLLRRLGLAYDEEKDEAQQQVSQAIARDGGTAVLSLAPTYGVRLLGPWNIAEGYWPNG